jgi:spore maturation protein SpmA
MLNRIWLGFFFLAFVAACWQWLSGSNPEVFNDLVGSTFEMSALAVEIAIGLIGLMALWLGLFKIAEQSGLATLLARGLNPLFARLMPEVPRNHPALGSITLNMAANMLGLDNAATPIGLKAMSSLQELNPDKDTASNAQILFLVLNTSSVTLLPVTIFMFRAQQGAAEPAAVFLPILMATSASTLVGLCAVAWVQKLQILDRVVLAYFAGYALLMSALVTWVAGMAPTMLASASASAGNFLLFTVIVLFLVSGIQRKLACYEVFIEGAKEGFQVAVRLIPFLLAMLVAIGVFRASGCLDLLLAGIRTLAIFLGLDTGFIDAIPTALMKPLSGSGARAMMLETMNTHGVDSFAALTSASIQGSTETTFYVLAVYFGSVGIRKTRHAIGCALAADFTGIVVAILASYWFFTG